jgi:hypothetical protein
MTGGGWLAAFPHEDARTVVAALCRVWRELTDLSAHTFHNKRREPELTELLCEQIRAVFKERTKLTGQWSYERRKAKIVKTGSKSLTIVDRKRTDIDYFSDRPTPPLELTFEFKKLDHTLARRKVYAGEDGMLRFVTGDYSVKQPVAVMVGILSNAHAACVPPLITFLQKDKIRTTLRMAASPQPCITAPSEVFDPVAHFDTIHTRDADLAPPHGSITLCHVFLGFA